MNKKLLKEKGEPILLFLLFFFWYCIWQINSVYGGDSGDLLTAAWQWGVPHPPGYPFYTLLGAILSHTLPFYTPAWRVGLISSLSSALTLSIFYLLIKKICQKTWPALLGALTLAFLYPFWLYSEVAEVFALNNLFALLLTYLFFKIYDVFVLADFNLRSNSQANRELPPAKAKHLRAGKFAITGFALILGLSLAHHHTIVLIFPGFLYLFFKNKKFKKNILKIIKSKQIFILIIVFLLGFSFYLYPLLACPKGTIVCWDNPKNLQDLIRLITRADYGTFRSSGNLGEAPLLRIISTLSFFKLLFHDFNIFGILLILLGFFYLFYKHKQYFNFFAVTLFTSLFFIFYASFILVNDFMVATFERFALLPYVFLTLLFSLGALFLYLQVEKLIKKIKTSRLTKKIFLNGLILILFLIPLTNLILNYQRITILKNDLTAEKTSLDFLNPLPQNSILLLFSDTGVFNNQYLRYALGFREDVLVLNGSLLPASYQQKLIKKIDPEIQFAQGKKPKELIQGFAQKNSSHRPVFIEKTPLIDTKENWAPHGLTWQYLPKEKSQLDVDKIVQTNVDIWKKFNNPLDGSLSQYKNLYLADNLRVYAEAAINAGDYFLKNNFADEALFLFQIAQNYQPENSDVYLGFGAVALKKGQCQEAEKWFTKAIEINPSSAMAYGYLRKTALECFQDEKQAKEYENECLQIKETNLYPLENLK